MLLVAKTDRQKVVVVVIGERYVVLGLILVFTLFLLFHFSLSRAKMFICTTLVTTTIARNRWIYILFSFALAVFSLMMMMMISNSSSNRSSMIITFFCFTLHISIVFCCLFTCFDTVMIREREL